MTPEQELTAMIEAELTAVFDRFMRHKIGGEPTWQHCMNMAKSMDALAEMTEPDRQNAALRKLYWLATDPDDMVH